LAHVCFFGGFTVKKLAAVIVIVTLAVVNLNCAGFRANVKRHPAIYGAALGAIGGTAYALATRHNCPNTYDGKPYQGTPPCPK
jgi:hypothetical protein